MASSRGADPKAVTACRAQPGSGREPRAVGAVRSAPPGGVPAAPRAVRDPYWQAAWAAIEPLLRRRDRLLLPRGDWPAEGRRSRFYDNEVRIGRASVLVLHKGRLGGITKPALRWVMRRWRCVFANEVLVCFRKPAWFPLGKQPHIDDPHACTLYEYVHSRRLKRINGTVYFSHIPKAAGTAVWTALSQQVRSSIYYDSFESFRSNPPRPGEYDLVGGHIPLPLLLEAAGAGDRVVGLVREPVARFRSAFLHSRRDAEDPDTFTPIMRAMRDTPLHAFLDSHDGRMEVRQQLLMLGFDYATDYGVHRDAELFRTAQALLGDERCLFRPTDAINDFVSSVATMLDLDPSVIRLSRHNAAVPAEADRSAAEFASALPLIAANNAVERDLYEFVRSRSDATRRDAPAEPLLS